MLSRSLHPSWRLWLLHEEVQVLQPCPPPQVVPLYPQSLQQELHAVEVQEEGFAARVGQPLLLLAFVHNRSPTVQEAVKVELVLMTKSEDSFPMQALCQ